MQTLTDEQAASLPAWLRALGEREKSLSLSRDGSSCEISLPVKFLATAADIFTQTITLPETNYGLDIDWESNSAGVPVIRWDRDSQVPAAESSNLFAKTVDHNDEYAIVTGKPHNPIEASDPSVYLTNHQDHRDQGVQWTLASVKVDGPSYMLLSLLSTGMSMPWITRFTFSRDSDAQGNQ
ncbi:hypothetical protein EHS25_004515 [Saitozyma podzolica]|jgi:hypothetical protein|uniref:Uncharacterized protein n=1 Tax=Saitozyma podzolica TaxID=1890683 RepID=A0A427YUA3_9TREE|nr:hypothetical protein EHS25_004515 [Saitozyma podzolica]